jgi:undecaprenol kinase
MNMDWSAKAKKVLKSFSYAFQGIIHALNKERNLKIHLSLTVLVVILGFLFSITKIEWLFILIAIGGVNTLELVNTAIERVVDLVTKEYQPLAKQAKDTAAGAV